MHLERIIDVNINRLNESLKLIEDIIRFSLENKNLLKEIRKIRNKFLIIKRALPLTEIISFRESQRDFGRSAKFDVNTKKTPKDLLLANLTRAKESSRTIEEALKSYKTQMSSKMKNLRFRIYDLEMHVNEVLKKTFSPRLYAIIDEKYLYTYTIKEMTQILEKYGMTMIQLRVKFLSDKDFYNYAIKIKKSISKPNIKFIINNRIDIAIACRADGVHLGQSDIPIKKARSILGEGYIIGASAHSIKDAKLAETQGADYIGVGSIFKTKTKPDAKVCSLSTLKSICKKISIPVIGIGGITNENYKRVFKAGASGIALSSYLFEGNLRKNIRSLTVSKS